MLNFAPVFTPEAEATSRSFGCGHYIMEKRHTMLCRLADGTSEISFACQRHCGVDATGMLKSISRRVREGYSCLLRTHTDISAILSVGIALFVSKQGLREPHQQAAEGGYPRFFCCVVTKRLSVKLNLGVIRHIIVWLCATKNLLIISYR